ncbi:beta-lactamase family protein [Vitreoscilla massiliensis]|uniref:Beta-lactamase family protein n=1 Tax=Vitreoscilla massiliensis TaxID=1689272 RepID=A0ABY4DZQ5_9NEIS|nr:serine hydrolase [Vitreoscilla massiliensis]UOO89005.1 beta-lactamase family protein [Vitreoscilla massiliensis]
MLKPSLLSLALLSCSFSVLALSPPPQSEPYIGTADNLYGLSAQEQAPTYRNMNFLYPTRSVAAGGKPLVLRTSAEELPVSYAVDGKDINTDVFMRRNQVAGLLIMRDGKILVERYAQGNTPDSRWTSFSIAKSISSTLIGAAVADGKIGSLNDEVTRYVPALKGSSYEGVSVGQVLDMSSGVKWNETYRDPKSDRRQMFNAQLAQQPGGIVAVMAGLKRIHPAGSTFNYSTGESYLQAEILKGATGKTSSAYLSEKIWGPLGMQTPAFWQLESPNGTEIASSGFSATLRDYARFGQFILNDGVINGKRVLPQGWVASIADVSPESHLYPGKLYDGEYDLGYHKQWWILPKGDKATAEHGDGAFSAVGIFGQYLYINPAKKTVAVVWSTWPEPEVERSEKETFAYIGAAIKASE